jgi:hypothetical protein
MKHLVVVGLFVLVVLNAALMEPSWLWYGFFAKWRRRAFV